MNKTTIHRYRYEYYTIDHQRCVNEAYVSLLRVFEALEEAFPQYALPFLQPKRLVFTASSFRKIVLTSNVVTSICLTLRSTSFVVRIR
jgi:NAD-dependent DNA ligase